MIKLLCVNSTKELYEKQNAFIYCYKLSGNKHLLCFNCLYSNTIVYEFVDYNFILQKVLFRDWIVVEISEREWISDNLDIDMFANMDLCCDWDNYYFN